MTGRALVTGAGGFVGGFLAEGLLRAGYAVTALDSAFDAAASHRLAGAECVEADIGKRILTDLGAFDLVIHGAAITSPAPELGLSQIECLQANCAMTLAMLSFAIACQAEDFVFLSSSGVFRAEDAQAVLLESTPARSSSAYAIAKRAGELFLEAIPPGRMRAIAVRLGPIYGPGERPRTTRHGLSPVRRWIDAASRGEPILVDLPHARRDWTYGPDLPDALLALLARQPMISGVIHLTSGEALDDAALADRIASHFGVATQMAPGTGERRLPMSSERIPPADLYAWTPISVGLQRVMGECA